MKTDDLIQILSSAGAAKAPKPIAWLLILAFVVFAGLTYLILGYRSDLMALHPSIGFFEKTALLAGIALWAAYALTQAAKPVGKPIRGMGVTLFLTLLFISTITWEWLKVPTDQILAPFENITFPTCLITVSLYGLVGMGALIVYLKRFAPGNIGKASMLTGLCAASFGALGYSFHCGADSPTYIAIAYGLPTLALVFLAGLIAPRFLRW